MITLTSRLLVAWLLIAAAFSRADDATNDSPKYVLFLTADGFRTDYIEWYNPPNLRKLITSGVRVLNATNVFPTLTTANMTSLVTGSYPRTTGIACNSQYVKELDKIVERPRDNKAETISDTLRKAGWKTGAVNHFMLESSGSTVYMAPGYEDSRATTLSVLEMLKTRRVRFVAAIYGAADHAGHKYGPRSDQVKAAVLGIDRAIGDLITGLKEQGIYDQTLIVFTADHGMSGFERKQASAEPAELLEEEGFKVATSNRQLDESTQIVVIENGVRLIYFRKLTPAEQQKALEVLSRIKGVEVLDRAELDALGCHDNRSGDVIVTPLPGYTMNGSGKKGGQHGRFAERNPVMIFCGPGIKRGVTVRGAQNIDVVPTILSLVGVAPAASVDGRAIGDAMERP